MTVSFTFSNPVAPPAPETSRKVLITGAGGRIGVSLAHYARQRYTLRLLVHREKSLSKVAECGEGLVGDLSDPACLRDACHQIDTVVHLAADPSPKAEWPSLLENNITGTYNVFMAALHAGCRRVILASSIHAVSGYPVGYQVHPDDPVNPGDLYGVSKCFGEALARLAAEQHGLSSIVLRIGAFQSRETARNPENVGMMDAFVSHRDLDQLICCCIDDNRLRFAVFHGLSNNRFNCMDISSAKELVGYAPDDDFTQLNRDLADLNMPHNVRPHDAQENHGAGLR